MQINKLSVMNVNNRSKTVGQMGGKHSTLWLTCALLAASWLLKCPLNGLVPQLKQVEATLWPKARICFNSMTSSFQSECVYCDSRLYASTINACTGQPVLAANITQAQAFCIATACLQQTGKQPVVLGRRRRKRRSLQFRPFGGVGVASKNLSYGGGNNYNKQYNKTSTMTNGNLSAQFDKLMNGTTSGNLNFVLHRPNYNSLWANNPLTRVLVRNATNKNIQWQFGRGTASTSVAVTKAASTTGASATLPAPSAAAPPATAAAPPKPAAPPAAPPKPAAPPAAAAPPKPAAPAPAAPAG